MDVKNEAGLGQAIHSVQQNIISAYGDNCPFKCVKTDSQSQKWTVELEFLRREVRGSLISADQTRIRTVGNFIEGLSGIIGRFLEMLGGLPVALLTTYQSQVL